MQKKHVIAVFLSLVILLVSSCAGDSKKQQQQQPDWIVGEAEDYPKSLYILGQGSATSLDSAKQRARADLAKVFEVAISETSSEIQKVAIDADQTATAEFKAQRAISTKVNQVLSGAQIAETWRDPQSNEYHALATLDRDSTARALRTDIRHLDDVTANYINKAQQQDDRLRLVDYAYNAYEAQLKRTALQKKLRVVDLSGRGIPAQVELAKLKADYEQVLGRVRIVAYSEDEFIQNLLAAGISQAGFNADSSHPPRYVLSGSLQTTPVIRRDGVYWLNASLDLALKENEKDGSVRGTDRWEVKVSATEEVLLQKRLEDELNHLNKTKLQDMIMGFAQAD